MAKPKSKARRRGTRKVPLTKVLLVLGALVPLGALCLRWVEVDPEAYGVFEDLLEGLGLLPEAGAPVRGFEIPFRVREATGAPVVSSWLVLDDLASGRLDRVTSRVLFGDYIEDRWAPIVFAPAALGLLGTALLRFRRATVAASWLLLLDAVVIVLFGIGAFRVIDGEGSIPLRILEGVPLTAAGLLLAALGAWRVATRRA
jgi:hypothetical protein